jgi:hypothetical protein
MTCGVTLCECAAFEWAGRDDTQRGRAAVRGALAQAADRGGHAPRSLVPVRADRTVRSWPLLVLAAPAAAGVWSGWVGIAQKTGFWLVRPLPGIWPSLHLDTAITLPVGVVTAAPADPTIGAWQRTSSDWHS